MMHSFEDEALEDLGKDAIKLAEKIVHDGGTNHLIRREAERITKAVYKIEGDAKARRRKR